MLPPVRESFAKTLFRAKSLTKSRKSPAIDDGRASPIFGSGILNVDLLEAAPHTLADDVPPIFEENDMIDVEDRAWDSPPPMRLNWTLPKLSWRSCRT